MDMNLYPHFDRVQAILAEAFQVPAADISPEMHFGDIPQWDSMGHMDVMMRLESEFGVEVNADTIASLTSIRAICNYLGENHKE
jgi:acyl carrier protein